MIRGAKSSVIIDSANELGVLKKVMFHFEMFAADWTVDDGPVHEAMNSPGCSGSHRAVDHDQCWAILFDILNGGADEPFAKWVANMKNSALTIGNHGFD